MFKNMSYIKSKDVHEEFAFSLKYVRVREIKDKKVRKNHKDKARGVIQNVSQLKKKYIV